MGAVNILLSGSAALCSLGLVVISRKAKRNDERIPVLHAGAGHAASLSIIVPARDEEENLQHLLPTLMAQTCAPLEILVVDDGSRDRTAVVARGMGAQVISVPGLPPGWTGKTHACDTGAQRARGEWLLFVDADVRLAPKAISAALGWAERTKADALSLLLEQDCQTAIERLMLPFAYAQYFAGAPVEAHFDPGKEEAILNGQFVLMRRSAYLRSGGFQLVKSAAMEDLALGRALKERGYAVALAHGEALGRVRMYSSLQGLWRGFAKTGAGSLHYNPRGSIWTVAAQMLTGTVAPLLIAALFSNGRASILLSVCAYLAGVRHVARWTRLYHVPIGYALLYPVSTPLMMAIVLFGLLRRRLGLGLEWKGRLIHAE